jgi:protein phosphatase
VHGVLTQLTRDHTAAWGQWKRGEITEIQYRTHPRRSALYEVIGGGHLNVCPHFAAIPYQHGDRFLICSDGLIDGLWERHISNALASIECLAEVAQILLKRAIDNSGIDDTTLIVVHVNDPSRNDHEKNH